MKQTQTFTFANRSQEIINRALMYSGPPPAYSRDIESIWRWVEQFDEASKFIREGGKPLVDYPLLTVVKQMSKRRN